MICVHAANWQFSVIPTEYHIELPYSRREIKYVFILQPQLIKSLKQALCPRLFFSWIAIKL